MCAPFHYCELSPFGVSSNHEEGYPSCIDPGMRDGSFNSVVLGVCCRCDARQEPVGCASFATHSSPLQPKERLHQPKLVAYFSRPESASLLEKFEEFVAGPLRHEFPNVGQNVSSPPCLQVPTSGT